MGFCPEVPRGQPPNQGLVPCSPEAHVCGSGVSLGCFPACWQSSNTQPTSVVDHKSHLSSTQNSQKKQQQQNSGLARNWNDEVNDRDHRISTSSISLDSTRSKHKQQNPNDLSSSSSSPSSSPSSSSSPSLSLPPLNFSARPNQTTLILWFSFRYSSYSNLTGNTWTDHIQKADPFWKEEIWNRRHTLPWASHLFRGHNDPAVAWKHVGHRIRPTFLKST